MYNGGGFIRPTVGIGPVVESAYRQSPKHAVFSNYTTAITLHWSPINIQIHIKADVKYIEGKADWMELRKT